MNILITIRGLLLALIVASVTSCGFQPRGSDALPVQMSRIYLEGDSSTPLYKSMRNALLSRKLEVVGSLSAATSQIVIHEEESGQRILSVAATDGPEEYEVFQTAVFSLSLDDTASIERQRLTLTRDYTYDRTDILGKRHEYESLRSALANEMAQAILRRARYAR